MWWRELYGSDEHLDENHLMRMAGRFSRRLRAWATTSAYPLVWEAQKTGTGKPGQLAPKDPWPYVNHYSFHIVDPGPVMLNGHEYVAAQAQKAGVELPNKRFASPL